MIPNVLLVLHLLAAVIWVGGMFFALAVLRPSLAVLPAPQRMELHMQVFRRFFLIVWHAMPVLLLTGFAMIFWIFGGFAHARWNVNLMMLLGLLMSGIFLAVFFGPWAQLRRNHDPATAERIRRSIQLNLALGLVVVIVAALNY